MPARVEEVIIPPAVCPPMQSAAPRRWGQEPKTGDRLAGKRPAVTGGDKNYCNM